MLWRRLITVYEKINAENPSAQTEVFDKAAAIIQSGGLVAFPTETVYGLGANALDPEAVKKIYIAKGRPSDNPLIVHISRKEEVYQIAEDISEQSILLMDKLWPGPLTIILKKKEIIPAETSGGLSTVGVRLPQSKAARYFIERAQTPIAAPSANVSGRPSPTRASHVQFDLNGKIDMIIDGGASDYGLESTIIDMSQKIPCLLRPGSVTKEMLESIIGTISIDNAVTSAIAGNTAPRAPGMKYKHYSPTARVVIVNGGMQKTVDKINWLVQNSSASQIGILATEQTSSLYPTGQILIMGDRKSPETIAANLFKMLRKCDYFGIDEVYAEGFSETEIGLAIMNRLKKAAGYNIINV